MGRRGKRMADSNLKRVQQISALRILSQEHFGLDITDTEAAQVLATPSVCAKDLPEVIRKLRVLH